MRRLLSLLSFEGRLGRLEYWRAYLTLMMVGGAVWVFGLFAILAVGAPGAVVLAPFPIVLVATFAIAVRRLHDRNRSGWWVVPLVVAPILIGAGLGAQVAGSSPPGLVLLGSLVGLGLSLWGWVEIGFLRGLPGANRYGEAPQAI